MCSSESDLRGYEARRDSVSRNGPPDCAKSVTPTAEIIGLKVGATDPAGRYRVSRLGAGPLLSGDGAEKHLRQRRMGE
jgi:hypothetical protein